MKDRWNRRNRDSGIYGDMHLSKELSKDRDTQATAREGKAPGNLPLGSRVGAELGMCPRHGCSQRWPDVLGKQARTYQPGGADEGACVGVCL
jgi:hypothetical protein